MTTDDERERLAQDLLRLGLPELVDVLRRVLPAHAEEDTAMPSVLILAEISLPLDGDSSLTEPPFIEAVAWPDRDDYDGGFGSDLGLYEQGRCAGCELDVISSAKRAFCPVCGAVCHLT
ncbi:hypothetical protein GCM10022254_50120 [Actinomadura meridiana]|uniref:Uncharacterized protein n=1 Tax=Actinomadura meridiana TaxID=559626 RepID=A0ABP8CCM5_9ACTN